MIPRLTTAILLAGTLLLASAAADSKSKPSSSPSGVHPMTKETRMMVIRDLNAEHVFARTFFPMGQKGLALKNGKIEPGPEKIQELLADHGSAAKPGDRIMITNVEIRDRYIHFEINGGPKKKSKWYQHLEVGGMGGTTPVAPPDDSIPHGSYVDLEFEHFVPEITSDQIKKMLEPVFDFNAISAVQAYLETVPPKVKEAIKDHKVLVGMNHEMVTYAKGRPPQKIREADKDTGKPYEEWIYGTPPEEVQFVRFEGDEVVRLEIMKVDGEKVVRTTKEVDLKPAPSLAESQQPGQKSTKAPTLRRPGEPAPEPPRGGSPMPLPGPDDPTQGPQLPTGGGPPQ